MKYCTVYLQSGCIATGGADYITRVGLLRSGDRKGIMIQYFVIAGLALKLKSKAFQ